MLTKHQHSSIVAGRSHCRSLLPKLAAKNPKDPAHVLFRRECYRWAFQAPAAIRYQTADGKLVAVEAVVEDLSATGMGLLSQEPLPANVPADVFISAEGRTYSAAVRLTRAILTAKGFRIGCEFVIVASQSEASDGSCDPTNRPSPH